MPQLAFEQILSYRRGRDAAYAANLRGYTGVIFGYLGGPNAYHPWSGNDWDEFPHHDKCPIWVGGLDGHGEALDALAELHALGVPAGVDILLDLETRIDRTYTAHFGAAMQRGGYKVLPYGSTGTLFANPQLNGYAVADPTGSEHMYPHPGVRITQYDFGVDYDKDAVKNWLIERGEFWR